MSKKRYAWRRRDIGAHCHTKISINWDTDIGKMLRDVAIKNGTTISHVANYLMRKGLKARGLLS